MKRLISWLLALTLIFGLVPMSAMAATDVEIGEGEPDIDVGFEQLLQGYTAENRLTVAWTWNKTQTEAMAQVTVPAGKTMYFEYQGDPSYALFVNGEEYEFTAAQGRTDTNKFQITNSTDAEVTYELGLKQPIGSFNNPEVIEELDYSSFEVEQAAGDNDGYFYTYTATETGIVTLYFDAVYDENYELVENVGVRDIMVTNQNTNAQLSLQQDGVDNNGLELVVPVAAGQTLLINTAWVTDAEGNYYPEGTYSWTGDFSYPAGSEQNPIYIEWAWDEAYTSATATVTVDAAGTYFYGENGMILSVNGTETEMENGVFVLDAGTYSLALTTPVGQNGNPEVIDDINGDFATGNLAEDAEGYYYIWTATEDGTVTLDASEGANIIVTHFGDVVHYEDEEMSFDIQEELTYHLATPIENEETWALEGWDVAENIQFEVKAGHSVKIQVVAMEVGNWEKPAISYILTGAFEAAVKCDHENLAANSVCPECGLYKLMGATINLGNSLQFAFFAKRASIDTNGYAVVTHTMEDGTVNTFTYRKGDPEWVDGTNLRINYNGLAAKHMSDQLTCTFYNASGEPISITWVDSMRDYAMRQVKNETNHITLRIAVVDMLIYGAASQVALNYNTGDLADKYLGDYRELATKSVTATNSIVKDSAYYGSVISVDNEIQFSIYLKNSVLTNIDNLTARISYKNHNGATKGTELKKGDASWVRVNNNYTRIYITGLTVADWSQDVTLEMVDADGTTVYSTNVDSMESYIARQIEKDGENAPAVFQAIAKFGTSAYNYFHRNDK